MIQPEARNNALGIKPDPIVKGMGIVGKKNRNYSA